MKTEHKILTIQDAPAEGDAFEFDYQYDSTATVFTGQVDNNLEKQKWMTR